MNSIITNAASILLLISEWYFFPFLNLARRSEMTSLVLLGLPREVDQLSLAVNWFLENLLFSLLFEWNFLNISRNQTAEKWTRIVLEMIEPHLPAIEQSRNQWVCVSCKTTNCLSFAPDPLKEKLFVSFRSSLLAF